MIMSMKIALQLYTLREECEKDFFGTLAKVAKLGFQGVEFAGFFGYSAIQVKEQLDQLGLVAMGSHTDIELLKNDLSAVIEFNKVINNPYIICPMSKWENRKGLIQIAELLSKASQIIREAGMTLLYHNHAHELETIEGQYGLDILFDLTEEAGVGIELDTHWLERVEVDSVEYMKKYGNRIKLVHLKDLQVVDGLKTYAALGEGIMDLKSIIETAKNIGLEWVTVENDTPLPNGFDNITVSINYLKALGY